MGCHLSVTRHLRALSAAIALLGFVDRSAANPLPVEISFAGAKASQSWKLAESSPGLPADWSPYEFLVLEMKASSSQRFELQLDTANGRFWKRIHPMPQVWVRAAVPLRYYRVPAGDGVDMAATFNQPRSAYWINIDGSGGVGPTTNVHGITVTMHQPVGSPTLQIRAISLSKTDPGDAVLEGKPVIDEFGQYAPVDWPGKARILEDLKRRWTDEERAVQAPLANRCAYGGFSNTAARATGFFRVERVKDRWWMVCPDGHLFYSSGVNGVGTGSGTRVEGREDLFASLPPANFGGGARRGFGGSFYTWNLQRRFGDEWRPKWADFTGKRLAAWGFNSVHNWGSPSRTQAEPRTPYAMMLRGWQTGRSIMGMPDVYAADFEERVNETAAAQLTPFRDDPCMLGYFIGNEPPWPGRENQLCDAILEGAESEIQKRLKSHLAERDTPERRKQFVLGAFQRYLDVINAAVRRHDTNHLNLGIRFGGEPHDEVIRMARGFDVFSVNIYSYAPERKTLDHIYALVEKPIIVGEFHIGVPNRGLAPGLVQAANQNERAQGYSYYVEQSASHPAVVGTHWFQWLDQPATGRGDGENYNIGFVDVTDQPYAEMVAAAKRTHSRLFEIHSGILKPTDRKPRAQ